MSIDDLNTFVGIQFVNRTRLCHRCLGEDARRKLQLAHVAVHPSQTRRLRPQQQVYHHSAAHTFTLNSSGHDNEQIT